MVIIIVAVNIPQSTVHGSLFLPLTVHTHSQKGSLSTTKFVNLLLLLSYNAITNAPLPKLLATAVHYFLPCICQYP